MALAVTHRDEKPGWVVNHEKIQRLWRQEGLTVLVRRRRKRAGSATLRNFLRRDHRQQRIFLGRDDLLPIRYPSRSNRERRISIVLHGRGNP